MAVEQGGGSNQGQGGVLGWLLGAVSATDVGA